MNVSASTSSIDHNLSHIPAAYKPTKVGWLPETIPEQATLGSQIYCKVGQQASLEYTCISILPQGWYAPECLLPHMRRCGFECLLHKMRNRQSRVYFPIWGKKEKTNQRDIQERNPWCPHLHPQKCINCYLQEDLFFSDYCQ